MQRLVMPPPAANPRAPPPPAVSTSPPLAVPGAWRRCVLPVLAAAVLSACTAPPPGPPAAAAAKPANAANAAPPTLRVIAFNDFHGHLEPGNNTLPWPDPADPTKAVRLAAGGAAPLAGLITALRAGAANAVVVSAGDLIGATPLVSALFFHESTIDIANRIGLDLAIPGNHEFDAGKAELLRVIGPACRPAEAGSMLVSCPLGAREGARFPHFAANVTDTTTGRPLFPPSIVKTVGGPNGIRVGFVGAVTRTTPFIVVPSGVAGLRFGDEAAAINAEVARLEAEGVRAIVVVIHEGGETGDRGAPLEWNDTACPAPRGPVFEIAKKLSRQVDLVLSAHTHQGYRCVVDGVPVLQATSAGRGVSVADLVLDPTTGDIDRQRTVHRNLPVFNENSDAALKARIVAAEPAPFGAALAAAVPDAAVAARVAQYAAVAAPIANRPAGRIGGSFDRDGRTDASAGRLVADAQWAATRAPDRGGARFALMNPGGVRTNLPCRATPPCDVTYGQLFAMQPFGNSLVVMTLAGAELKALLESQARPGRPAPLFLIPSASLTYRWAANAPAGQRVQELRLDGRPVQPADELRFTVNSFLAEGGDGFPGFTRGRDRLGGPQDLDALVAWLSQPLPPAPVAEPRIGWVE
jgi:5'-nucleotidase